MPSPSADWNRPYNKHEECVALKAALTRDPPVRYPDGDVVGDGYDVPRSPELNARSKVEKCVGEPGAVRIDMTEVLPAVDGRPALYFHKGGQGYKPASVPYGHLSAKMLRSSPRAHFSKAHLDEHGADPGNNPQPGPGRAHRTTGARYRVLPKPIGPSEPAEAAWLYKNPRHYPPSANLSGARYTKYGDAGPWQGTRDEHFAYLCWSWLRQGNRADDGEDRFDVSGGGAVRALLKPGQIVHRCDVASINSPAWDRRGNEVGRVVAIYARVPLGGVDLYGWMVHSHLVKTADGFSRVMHVGRAAPGIDT